MVKGLPMAYSLVTEHPFVPLPALTNMQIKRALLFFTAESKIER